MSLIHVGNKRASRDKRVLEALTLAITDKVISNEEERVLWKALTYLMNDKLRVQKLKFILQKKFGTVRQKELVKIILSYFKKVDGF